MYALTNAKIYTVTNGIIENGKVLVKNGKIEAVGAEISIPAKCKTFDLKGQSITPTFIDSHCHVGVFNEGAGAVGNDGNDYSKPVTAEVKAVDGIYGDDEGFRDAIEHGVGILCIPPGSANVIGGQAALVKVKSNYVHEMLLDDYIGLKCAFGENPKRVYGGRNIMPTTRMGVAAIFRKTMTEVANYKAKKEHHENSKPKEGEPKAPFAIDYSKEILLECLNGKKPMRAHAHRADDIQTAIRLAEEFGLKIVIEHATEGYKIADFLAKKGISIIIGPLNITKPKVELKDASMDAPRILEKAGVHFAVMTDAPVKRIANLFDDVRLAIRHGLSKEMALKSITINPAEILGYSDRFGSIECGKDADLNVFTKDPFDFLAKVSAAIIDGNVVHGKL